MCTPMEVSAKYAALLRQIFSMRPKKNQDLNTIKVFACACTQQCHAPHGAHECSERGDK